MELSADRTGLEHRPHNAVGMTGRQFHLLYDQYFLNYFKNKKPHIAVELPADRTGLEPATSAVTGRHSNQLNYRSNIFKDLLFYLITGLWFEPVPTLCRDDRAAF